MTDATYANLYKGVNFREHPEKYVIGKGEQGVLIAEPYKSEILPYWRFATEETARHSAQKIYDMFEQYGRHEDFVGMDMARKFLQMGFTRARRYANHASGRKYDQDGAERAQETDWKTSEKARAAVFYEFYKRARADETYIRLRQKHQR